MTYFAITIIKGYLYLWLLTRYNKRLILKTSISSSRCHAMHLHDLGQSCGSNGIKIAFGGVRPADGNRRSSFSNTYQRFFMNLGMSGTDPCMSLIKKKFKYNEIYNINYSSCLKAEEILKSNLVSIFTTSDVGLRSPTC